MTSNCWAHHQRVACLASLHKTHQSSRKRQLEQQLATAPSEKNRILLSLFTACEVNMHQETSTTISSASRSYLKEHTRKKTFRLPRPPVADGGKKLAAPSQNYTVGFAASPCLALLTKSYSASDPQTALPELATGRRPCKPFHTYFSSHRRNLTSLSYTHLSGIPTEYVEIHAV